MLKMDKGRIYRLAGKILSSAGMPAESYDFEKDLSDGEMNWKGFVKLGSDHLVLPALYLNLERKNALHHLPEDLIEYLFNILIMNRERNKKILSQVDYLKELLEPAEIQFIVMKGVGHMLESLYNDIGERMVYDIDILVEKGQMIQAADILQANGFFTQKPFNPHALESTMHYPVLLHEGFVAGFEIHNQPVQYLYENKFSSVDELFQNGHKTSGGFLVMSHPEKIIHNFIHSQLMHSGHYHASVTLRDLYDLHLLGLKSDLVDVFRNWGHYPSKTTGYMKLMYKTTGLAVPEEIKSTTEGNLFLKRQEFTLTISGRKLRYYHFAITLFQKYMVLPARILWNKKARNYVFSRLSDKGWYARHFAGIKRILNR
jgi:hypothetical protein